MAVVVVVVVVVVTAVAVVAAVDDGYCCYVKVAQILQGSAFSGISVHRVA